MKLEGSCHCGAVRFRVEAPEPTPYLLCYCSICRKTAGSGGFGINLGARTNSLEVDGEQNVRRYHPATGETGQDLVEHSGRRFCSQCGSPLWNFDIRWPNLIHPHAGAIDTELPVPPERTHIMLGSAAGWVEPSIEAGDRSFDDYPKESLADWHKRVMGD